jgi:glycine/D-amino acid oxidase-like deaminating enzyme
VVASGLGFTLGPVLGRLTAELVGEGETSLPTDQLRLENAWADS